MRWYLKAPGTVPAHRVRSKGWRLLFLILPWSLNIKILRFSNVSVTVIDPFGLLSVCSTM